MRVFWWIALCSFFILGQAQAQDGVCIMNGKAYSPGAKICGCPMVVLTEKGKISIASELYECNQEKVFWSREGVCLQIGDTKNEERAAKLVQKLRPGFVACD